jgi:chromosome segregation ATPase
MEDLARRKAASDDLEVKQAELVVDIADLNNEHGQKLTLQGQLQAEAESQVTRIADRAALIVKFGKKHGITGYESPEGISAADADQFVTKLLSAVQQTRQSQQVTKDEMKEGEDRLLAQLSVLKSEMAGFEEGKKSARKQLESNRNKIANITNKIQNARVSMGDVENQTSRVEEEVSLLMH